MALTFRSRVLSLAGVALLIAATAGCNRRPEPAPVIGEAYVAPPVLKLRKDISLRSEEVATLRHGEKVGILQIRRRFVKVRTSKGIEGWTDNRQLLTSGQMESLKALAEYGKKLPSQGEGIVHESLNIHIDPNRQSPSFAQIPEKGVVEVIGRKVTPRVAYVSPPLIPQVAPSKSVKKNGKDKEKKPSRGRLPPPPRPAPPPPPPNWLEISRQAATPGEVAEHTPPSQAPPVKYDEWNLVRTKDGKVGWALARMIMMAIPDEVAQYSEGHRITSYFSLGDVKGGDGETRHHWLWTTLSPGNERCDFDGFRVFVYNTRRSRYETAYRERDVCGYYPVELVKVKITEGKKTYETPGFSLILEDDEGKVWKKTYSFQVYRVRNVATAAWERPGALGSGLQEITGSEPLPPAPEPSWLRRSWDRVRGWFRRS